MKFVLLTHAEAADDAVMRNVATFLMTEADQSLVFPTIPVETTVNRPVLFSDPHQNIVTLGNVPAGTELASEAMGRTAAEAFGTNQIPVADNPAIGQDVGNAATLGQGVFDQAQRAAQNIAAAEAFKTAPTTSTAGSALPALAPLTDPAAGAPSASATPSVPASTATNSGRKLDAAGIPHDPRIHSASATTIDGGFWRKKRNVSDEEYNRVLAEIKQTMAAPGPASNPATPVQALQQAVQQPAAPLTAAQAFQPAATGLEDAGAVQQQLQQQQAQVPPAAAAAGGLPTDFMGLMQRLTPHMNANAITAQDLMNVSAAMGLPNPGGLMARGDLVPDFTARINALLQTKGMTL